MAESMAGIALKVSAALGGPYHDAHIITQAGTSYDDGGSLSTTGEPTYRTCSAQVDAATDAMRREDGFTEEDRRILVLAGALDGTISPDDEIELLAGPYTGSVWSVQSIGRESCAIYHELRARPV